jgi:hypothetical protein
MEHLGYVEAEGGPLILMDSALARSWTGSESNDYARACEFFDSHPEAKGGAISVGSGRALVWEMNGAGTANIYKVDGNGIMVVRAWFAGRVESSTPTILAEEPSENLTALGDLEVNSDAIVILWATENGHSIGDSTAKKARRPQSLNLDTAGLIVPLMPGKYKAKHDLVKRSGSEAQRLHLTLSDATAELT